MKVGATTPLLKTKDGSQLMPWELDWSGNGSGVTVSELTDDSLIALVQSLEYKETEEDEKPFYEKYQEELVVILIIITLLAIFIFLAKRYSYIRTMLIVSVLYLVLAFFVTELHYSEALLVSIPVWIFWGFRFIKYGALDVFKDKNQ